MIAVESMAMADGWWWIAPAEASTDVDRRWIRRRVAAWAALEDDHVRPLIADQEQDGTQTGAPVLVIAGPGTLHHDADLLPCACDVPHPGDLWDADWCIRCTGVIR